MTPHRDRSRFRTPAARAAALVAVSCLLASGCGGGGGGAGGGAVAASLASLSPSSAVAGGGAFTLTVNGSGFAAGTQVAWSGSNRVTTFVSATQLTAEITAADVAAAGTAQVTAVRADGASSDPLTFTITPPVQAASCLVSQVTNVAGAGVGVTVGLTYDGQRRIAHFGQVGAGAGYDVAYDAQGKITSLSSGLVTWPVVYDGAFITGLGGNPMNPTYAWDPSGSGDLFSFTVPVSDARVAIATQWSFDATGAVRSQQLSSATSGTQDQWAVSTNSPVAPLPSPFLGTTHEQRFLYFYALYGSVVGSELLVGRFLSTDTFESFGYSTGVKKHLAYYDFEYTVDVDGKVTKIVGFQTDGPTPIQGGTITLAYDCR
jgi:hypothetical protein